MDDVISAFLDNESFDGEELAAALANREGRELLLDLIALRGVVQRPMSAESRAAVPVRHLTDRLLRVVAALAILVGGYALGQWASASNARRESSAVSLSAPEPTSEVKFEPGVNWQEASTGGGN